IMPPRQRDEGFSKKQKKPASPVSRIDRRIGFSEWRSRVQIHGGSAGRLRNRASIGGGGGGGRRTRRIAGRHWHDIFIFTRSVQTLKRTHATFRALAFNRFASLILELPRLLDNGLRRDNGERVRNLRFCVSSVF
ncbi:MAG: hypothetical protein AAB380_09010, partial [Verrucomicrobiota bacterium]